MHSLLTLVRPQRLPLVALTAALLLTLTAPAAAGPPELPEQANDRAREATGADDSDDTDETDEDARVVMATVDSFTNPYHEFFHAGGPLYGDDEPSSVTQEVLDEFGITDDHVISLTRTGNFAADFAADAEQFDAIERGQPYWFEGTNIIGISFRSGDGNHLRPDGGQSAHGVGVTAAALEANPEGIIVSIDGINSDAEEWAFTHPAVDLVNTSYGTPAGEPDVLGGFGNLDFSYTGVVDNGKHHFGAVANTPMPSPIDPTGGPWWTVGVAGYEEGSSEGRQLASGSLADFVGDFTQTLPYCRNCTEGTSTVGGTSFASPRSMGTFSVILLEARRAAGHTGGIITDGVDQPLMVTGDDLALTNWDLRRALEEAAVYPEMADYDPTADPPFGATSAPAIDAAPWSTFGWGVITPHPDADVVGEALAHAGVTGDPERSKSGEACDWMTAQIEARMLYWDELEPGSDSAGEDHGGPYVRC